jgi:WD40 repeat protein
MHQLTPLRLASLLCIFCLDLALASPPVLYHSPNLGDSSCDSLLLVSSWKRNNVKIYDGCSGDFIRDLDSQNLIDGPLGILQAPYGDVLVISETNGRLLKFDYNTLSIGRVMMGDDPATPIVESNFIKNPVGAVIGNDGFMYAASYGTNEVVKVNTQSWTIVEQMLAADNGLIKGIDVGMTISDDGYLYLPGYDSDNIIKLNLTDQTVTNVVSPSTEGLDAPRSILLRNQEMLVTAERSNKIMIFDLAGNFKQTLMDVVRPTGLQKDGDTHFIVNTSNAVFRVLNDGSEFEQVVQSGSGDLAGGTFVYRLFKTMNKQNKQKPFHAEGSR